MAYVFIKLALLATSLATLFN